MRMDDNGGTPSTSEIPQAIASDVQMLHAKTMEKLAAAHERVEEEQIFDNLPNIVGTTILKATQISMDATLITSLSRSQYIRRY